MLRQPYSDPNCLKTCLVTAANSDKACNAIVFPKHTSFPVQQQYQKSPLSVGQLSFAGLLFIQLHSMTTGETY